MKIKFNFGNGVLNLPISVLSVLPDATADELRLLIALAAENGDVAAASALSGVTPDGAENALRRFEGAGLVAPSLPDGKKEAAPRRPAYSGEEMERIAETSDTRELLDVCAAILGKTFTAAEAESVFYLHDGLRLDFEYIVKLCKHCHDIGKPSLRFIEKVGISLYDDGVTTVGALDAYIIKEKRKSDMEYRVRRLYGLGERALTPTERGHLARWTIEWNLSYELIELAYNEMMNAISQPKFSYENGILKKWVEAGIRDKEGAEAFVAAHKKEKKSGGAEKTVGFDLDEFFAAAQRRGAASEESSENGKK